MAALTEFLYPAPARRTAGSIIVWWERRRLAYNVAVGAAGLISLGYGSVAAFFLGGGGPPLMVAVIFGVLANLCYLLGPAAEILIEKLFGGTVLPTGPGLYRMGLTFSVGLALFPSLLITIALIARFFAGLFGLA